jgi:hypothetical protein
VPILLRPPASREKKQIDWKTLIDLLFVSEMKATFVVAAAVFPAFAARSVCSAAAACS